MDFARDDALGLDFHPALGKDDAIEFPGNHHVIAFDLPFHSRTFAQDQAMGGNHVSLYMRVDAKYAGGLEGPLKAHAFVEEAGKFMLLRCPCRVLLIAIAWYAPRRKPRIMWEYDFTRATASLNRKIETR